MRLLTKVKDMGEASLEDKLYAYGDISKYINQTQWHGLLKYHDTAQTDYIRLDRVTGFAYMKAE